MRAFIVLLLFVAGCSTLQHNPLAAATVFESLCRYYNKVSPTVDGKTISADVSKILSMAPNADALAETVMMSYVMLRATREIRRQDFVFEQAFFIGLKMLQANKATPQLLRIRDTLTLEGGFSVLVDEALCSRRVIQKAPINIGSE